MTDQAQAQLKQQLSPVISGPQTLLITILQALTNGCDCTPCQSLRAYGKILAKVPVVQDDSSPPDPLKSNQDLASDPPSRPAASAAPAEREDNP